MGNNDLTSSENILVKVDHNNLMYIDPNSVVVDGMVEPRGIKQEELVIYVNLEADLIPRTTLVAENDRNTLSSIAKGTLNFLKNGDGGDFDSSWTNAYDQTEEKTTNKKDEKGNDVKDKDGNTIKVGIGEFFQSDKTGQSFGIDSINITVKGAQFIPQVTINFIDVRGKTLFESPENSPYKAFFHIPWPIFYLTVKGYYGKAIRYRLHLVKFNTRFNDTNGNFEVQTTFIGSTYAFMSDIPLKGAMNAPYMYKSEIPGTAKYNEKLKVNEVKISKSSRGYRTLSSIFTEMKQKHLIDQDVPVKTLRELGVIASSLDKILEKQIFDEVVDPKVFAGIKDFEDKLKIFEDGVNAWGTINLSKEFYVISGVSYFYLSDKKTRTSTEFILGKDKPKTLETLLENGKKSLQESQLFNQKLKNKTNGKFVGTINVKNVSGIASYYTKNGDQYVVMINSLFDDLAKIRQQFNEQRKKLEEDVEKKMNEIVMDTSKGGLGFKPTVRNLFGIIVANAEVYVRLMKDVHYKAFNISEERKTEIKNYSDESKGESIYPWPEIKKNVAGKKEKIIAYPGEDDLQKNLKSNDTRLWPEVGFVEEFIGISTNLYDPLSEKEGGVNDVNFVFESNADSNKIKSISSLVTSEQVQPYVNKSISSFLYEIYERARYFTSFDSFNNNTLRELANIEFDNIKESTIDDLDIVAILKTSITSPSELDRFLLAYSQFERYPYKQDQLPTVDYLKDVIDNPFFIEQYDASNNNRIDDSSSYPKLTDNLVNYVAEPYRKSIYPFNSSLYLSYLNKTSFDDNNFKFKGDLAVNTKEGFICSTIDADTWIKNGFKTNMFSNKLQIGSTYTNILNTPYFHNQLYSDFIKTSSKEKYVGSAYLLLNSLPFLDLEDTNRFGNSDVPVSSIFREIGATHFVPYHLIAKWGSIYHRYKKYITEGVDILNGCITTGNTTLNINGNLFFNNNETGSTFTTFTVTSNTSTYAVTYSGSTFDIGIHPFYDAIYHQVINGYDHYIIESGDTSYSYNVSAGAIVERVREQSNGIRYWTGFVDNSKFKIDDLRYTLLPSDGANLNINRTATPPVITPFPTVVTTNSDTFQKGLHSYFRIIWENDPINNELTGFTFPSYSQYPRTYVSGSTNDNKYSLGSNYRKVIDLIGTFSPKILEQFEDIFLNFSNEKLNDGIPYNKFKLVKHSNFQSLLKEICSVKKETTDDTDVDILISQIQIKQKTNLEQITIDILNSTNLLKINIGNPKEIDDHVFHGFSKVNTANTFAYDPFDTSQLTPANAKYIKLYIGEDIDGYYQDFFVYNDVELNQDNILQFRPLILIYAGYRKDGGTNTLTDFQNYIKNSVYVGGVGALLLNTNGPNPTNGQLLRLSFFLQTLINKFTKLEAKVEENKTIIKGYNNKDLKIELYNFFKSFNDKWVAGNSIGQRLLMEEFLFLDKANQDIGDKVFLNLSKFTDLLSPKNDKLDLYTALSVLIQGSNMDMRALPAYVNFYGTSISSKNSKIEPSKNVAANVFGTFLEVDYQESSPKIIIQYIGPNSKYPDMSESRKFGFNDDSFDLSVVNGNPLIITTPNVFNDDTYSKSNKVVAFEVSFGDQNQGIFKGVSLDQASIKNTSESFVVMENLARSESGAGTYNVDIGLFEIYRQASYSCEVTMMGDMMIQPTMFFYLKNIPMFKGSYWITEVSHSIKGNNITTTFKGSRIPTSSLPDPGDSFMSSYKPLFDRIVGKAIARVKEETKVTSTSIQISTPNGNFTTDPGDVIINGEELVKDAGVDDFGVPYNGYGGERNIQKVKYKGDTYYRARVVFMGGTTYQISDDTNMSLCTETGGKPLPWSEIKNKTNDYEFYSLRFDRTKVTAKTIQAKTLFYNPLKKKNHVLTFELSGTVGSRKAQGQINVGPNVEGYGIAMSIDLMRTLDVIEGEIIYFTLE